MSQFGPTYRPATDRKRLIGQMDAVRDTMLYSPAWMTLEEIAAAARGLAPERRFPLPSVSAQLRHLRKPQFGGYILEKRHRGNPRWGLWEYRLSPPPALEPSFRQRQLFPAARAM